MENDHELEFWRRSDEARAYATLGLTGLYIVHGGALTALLTAFSDLLLNDDRGLSTGSIWLQIAFIAFASGIILTLASTLLAYFAAIGRAPVETERGWEDRVPPWVANILNGAAEASATGSLIAFFVGVLSAGIAFW